MAFAKGFKIYEPVNYPTLNPSVDNLIATIDDTGGNLTYQEVSSSYLQGGTKEYRYIVAFDDENTGSPSLLTSIVNLLPPSSIVATAIARDKLQLSFTDAQYYASYKYKINSGTEYALDSDKIIDTGLAAGTTYNIQLATVNASGDVSAYSSAIQGTTWANLVTPNTPTTSGVTSNSITWSWTDTNQGVDYYELVEDFGDGTIKVIHTTASGSEKSWTETGLRYNTTYKRKVRAIRGVEISLYSAEKSQLTSAKPGTNPPPDVPTNFAGNAQSNTSIKWSWDIVAGETGYRVYDNHNNLIGTVTAAQYATDGGYLESGLSVNNTYVRYAVAYNTYGESSATASVSKILLTTPIGLSATISGFTINYSWTPVTGIDGYKLYSGTTLIGTIPVGTNTYSETNGEQSKSVYVVAYKSSSESAHSSIIPVLTLPNAPSNLQIEKLSDRLRLTWTNNSTIASDFRIEKRVNTGLWTEINTSNTVSYSDTFTFAADTTYEYRVRAYNATGNSATYSSVNGIIISLSTPTINNPVLVDASNQVTYLWSANAKAEGYKLLVTRNGVDQPEIDCASNSYVYNFAGSELNESVKVRSYVHSYDNSTIIYSSYSTVKSTLSSPKFAPTNVTITKKTTAPLGLQLAWTNNSAIQTKYKIQKRVNGGTWTDIATQPTTESYTDTFDYSADTKYEYQVRASNTVGDSPYNTVVPQIVTSLSKLSLTGTLDDANSKVTYSWSPIAVASGYKLTFTNNGVPEEFDLPGTSKEYTFVGESIQSASVIAYRTEESIQSPTSDTVNIISSPRNAVANLAWTADETAKQITVTFNDKSTVESGFHVRYKYGSGQEQVDTITTVDQLGIDDLYTHILTFNDFLEDINIKVEPYNNIGVASYSEIKLLAAPKAFHSAFVSNKAKFGWADNSDKETSFRLEYTINAGAKQTATIASDSTVVKGNNYTYELDLTTSQTIIATLYQVKSGYDSLPSRQITLNSTIYQKEPAPTDLNARWISEGNIQYYWTGNTIYADGYNFVYSINGGSETTIPVNVQLGDSGQHCTADIPVTLVTDDIVTGKVQPYTLVDTGLFSNDVQRVYYYVEDTSPPSTFYRIGTLIKWTSVPYAETYQIHYTIDGVETVVNLDSTKRQYYLSLDYSVVTSQVDVNMKAFFMGGKESVPTSTLSFTPTYYTEPSEVFQVNNLTDTYDSVSAVSNNGVKQSEYVELLTYWSINEQYGLYTLTGIGKNLEFQNVDLITVNYEPINEVYDYEAIVPNATTEKYDDVQSSIYQNLTFIRTDVVVKSCDVNQVNTFTNQPYISNLGVTEAIPIESIIGSYNTVMVSIPSIMYGYTATSIDNGLVETTIHTLCTLEYPVVTDVHRIIVGTIGDSITAGHPGYWAESGTGIVTSQYQYWLQKRLGEEFSVINKGYGSNTTQQCLDRFDRDIVSLSPQYVIIQAGINDLYSAIAKAYGDPAYLSQVVAKAKTNIDAMITKSLDNGIKPIIGTLLPYSNIGKNTTYPMYKEAIWSFNQWIKDNATLRGVNYVDFYNAGKDAIPKTPLEFPEGSCQMNPYFDGDSKFDSFGNLVSPGSGIHPSVSGYKIMAEAIPLTLFETLSTDIKIYIDPECTTEEQFANVNYVPTYTLDIKNLNRGRIKTTRRYIKNVGNRTALYAFYPIKEAGVEIKLSNDNGITFVDSVSGKLDPQGMSTVHINVDVPRIGEMPQIEFQLAIRSIQ